MSGGPGVQYKFSQAGLDEVISQVKALHSELRDGTITYQQYKQQMQEVSAQGRAATQEFNQMKGAVAASNPEVLQLTRSMSSFGSVAQTVLSVTNAINLAQMASMGIDQTVMQDKTQLAAAINQAAKDLAAFGPNSAQYQTDMQNVSALTNKLGYDQQQLGYQSISTAATLVASGVAIVGGISQSYLGISAAMKSLTSDAALAENVGIAFTAMGNAMVFALTSVIAPILVAAAALYGLEAAAQAVFPQFKGYMSDLQSSIQSSWNVSGLEAYLISPFVGAYVDIMGIGSQIQQGLVSVYNGIITQFLDPLITAFDDTIGRITGQIQTINTMKMPTTPTTGSILAGLGITATPGISGTAAGQDTITGADTPTNQQLQQMQGTSTQQLQQLLNTGSTTSQILQSQIAAGASIDAANSNLVTINTNIPETTAAINTTSASQVSAVNGAATTITAGITNLGTTMTASQTAQTAAVTTSLTSLTSQLNSTQTQIATLQAQAAVLAAQPQTMDSGMNVMDNGDVIGRSGAPTIGNGSSHYMVATAAANQLAQVNQQIQQLQQQANAIQSQGQSIAANGMISGALDVNSSGVDAVLGSLGLDSSTGIGSIIAGALGNEGGVGGAGISAAALQDFASGPNQGDYGIFTKNAIADNSGGTEYYDPNTNSVVQYTQQQITQNNANSMYQSLIGSGISTSLAQQATEKEYPGIIKAATGFEGTTTGPTSFLAGEAGPEKISIAPLGGSSNSKAGITNNVYVTVQGTVKSDNELASFIGEQLKQQLRGVGFT